MPARWNLVHYLIQTYSLKGAAAGAVILGGFLLCMIVPYLLGSLNFGLIISRRQYHDDVRTHGSGNAGTTNMLRTYGKKAAVLTLLGDMLKAVVAVGLGYAVLHIETFNEAGELVMRDPIGAAIAGLFVMLGHMFPCFFKFKGGKGVATAGVVVLMISPLTFLVCFGVFAVIILGTKFVSLGSIMGMILYPLVLVAFLPNAPWATIMAVIMATLVVVKHKDNIKRLSKGEESKLSLGQKKHADDTAGTTTGADDIKVTAAAVEDADADDATGAVDAADNFVTCVGCGKLIPLSREVCAYCRTKNPHFAPGKADGKAKKPSRKANKS